MIRLLLTAGALALVVVGTARDGTDVNGGVFSATQVERGELKYLKTCRECHERNLMGGGYDDIPPIIGDEFLSNWKTWTVGDLFDFLQNEMPPKRKDRVGIEPDDYADMLAYILNKNGFPIGRDNLPTDFDTLFGIMMAEPRNQETDETQTGSQK